MKEKKRAQDDQRGEGTSTTAARSPSQARGRDRIESILDATAQTIVESGLAAVTMHGVAKLAGAPVGSMYHFFPDRDALLAALRDRHDAALTEVGESIEAVALDVWLSYTAEEVIQRMMTPFIEYIEQHPDCLQLHAGKHPDNGRHEKGSLRNSRVIAARLPHAKPAERELCAEMLEALAVGALHFKLERGLHDARHAGRYMREVMRALAAYLSAVEASYAHLSDGADKP